MLNTSAFAQSKIFINEFLIDPQPQSVEIFNSGSERADISDWIIDDSGGTTFFTIPKESVVFPNQCLVFSADFNLNKTSTDTIKLINTSQQVVDLFSYKSSSGSGISYFRSPDGADNWATGPANIGFYNMSKEQKCLLPTLTPSPTLKPTLTIIPTSTPTLIASPEPTAEAGSPSYDNIYLSEAMVNPLTGEKEWVEIYNNNDFLVLLNNWYIDDLESAGSTPKTFSLEINAKSYGVFDLNSSMFNNDGDSARLLDNNKSLKDDFEYQKTETGKTLGRNSLESDYFCLQEPSKNSSNNPCINPTPTPITPSKTINSSSSIINPSDVPARNASQSEAGGSIHRSINYPTGITKNNLNDNNVLGITDELIINTSNNKSLINLLSFLSFSFSILVIVSVLIKSKILNKYALAS